MKINFEKNQNESDYEKVEKALKNFFKNVLIAFCVGLVVLLFGFLAFFIKNKSISSNLSAPMFIGFFASFVVYLSQSKSYVKFNEIEEAKSEHKKWKAIYFLNLINILLGIFFVSSAICFTAINIKLKAWTATATQKQNLENAFEKVKIVLLILAIVYTSIFIILVVLAKLILNSWGEKVKNQKVFKEKSCGAIVFKKVNDLLHVLLVEQNVGNWSFPKGHVEEGESEEETAIREVKEETNIDINIIPNFREISTYSPKLFTMKDVIFFVAKPTSDILIKQDEEIKVVEWVSIKSAKNRITHDSDIEILNKAVEFYIQKVDLFK
ncbi:NUDIX domain-containing protein [Metamycoplasma subdolum]|uniref:Bis(5'-nucleosyl)-tetraphosphatase [asymmetrical] n=1 Tax=Metamycoplasma subdolum TaxID=92407 RepID=A0A3M0A0U2_9BACT|nr:NUDIX domain-containing protein [Metamycoplasma subdolum]RMA78623.1 NUDIX domain-containing protein [Metamycoplasma subdolum]WPB50775.1 NUDIX domain-containing protein [Metamycoplasma subdolum]